MASLQTPRQRGLPRYSTNSTAAGNSPNNGFGASTSAMRQSTLRALNGQAEPKTPAAKAGEGDLEVGDVVNVPGDMFGTVRFVGTVRGKNGTFVGVELHEPFASRGKNDGDVDGISYFTTTVPGAGIFLPIQRAAKRNTSPTAATSSSDSYPGTPNTPSYTSARTGSRGNDGTSAATALPSKLAQSVGPGVRPSSPNFKPKRPSLPRPESPLRKVPPTLAPTPGRAGMSQSVMSKTPAKSASHSNFKASTSTARPSMGLSNNRPYSRSSSRMANGIEDDPKINGRTTSSGSVPSFSQPLRSPSRLGSAGGSADEVQRLKRELVERDKRLEEQAANLAEMEQSVKELSAIIPMDGALNGLSSEEAEDHKTVAQFRQLLREKNDKISLLTAEFDAHRADFRSTLDSLEMASTETERVYEEQKRDLLAQLHEIRQSGEDFDGVARQLKQLEEFVAELEEGLEESRRGEAEARGEVEFLRGEVERGRSELRREREKAARGSAGVEGDGKGLVKEMERKEDEIRGLKAIIHGLSSTGGAVTPDISSINGDGADAEEVKRLREELAASRKAKEGLEEEVETLRRRTNPLPTTNGAIHSRSESQRTATGLPVEGAIVRPRADTVKPTPPLFSSSSTTPNGTGAVYCEMCESSEHDTLECSRLSSTAGSTSHSEAEREVDSPGKENRKSGLARGEKEVELGGGAEDKWCALCEKDGHLAFDCPEEVY